MCRGKGLNDFDTPTHFGEGSIVGDFVMLLLLGEHTCVFAVVEIYHTLLLAFKNPVRWVRVKPVIFKDVANIRNAYWIT